MIRDLGKQPPSQSRKASQEDVSGDVKRTVVRWPRELSATD